MRINNTDLKENKHRYTIEELEENVDHLNLGVILSTQTLTPEFCIKHYLNDVDVEESYKFTETYIVAKQPHITIEQLLVKTETNVA